VTRPNALGEYLRARRELMDPAAAGLRVLVASFRASLGTDTGDPRTAQLVGELSLASGRFRQLWARHDVKPLAGGRSRIRHPQAGILELRREKLSIGDTGGQLLVIYHAEPGSASARSLALLGSLAAADEATPAGAVGTPQPRTSSGEQPGGARPGAAPGRP
jgi:hypothetical protein